MKSFKQYITEGSDLKKGWAKGSKMLIHTGMKPYHVEQLVTNLSKFGIKKADVMKILVREEKMAVCGMCFKWANDWNMKHHKGGTHKVVHGVVTNIKGKTFPHAWIEDKGKVYDVHSGEKGIVLNRYYKLLDPQDVVKYTPTKATQTLVRTRHHGPWDKKFDKWPTT